jgi:hypothetical protein
MNVVICLCDVKKLEERLLMIPNVIHSLKDNGVYFKRICLIDSMEYFTDGKFP